ncbi:MAG: creatininase family protein [Myxococcaceae bacterium]|nr:creatininase family protein [Myxococcaceae bacterium]
MNHLAAQLSWPKVKVLAVADAWALLPVGSTEAHGPHLPLNVDVVIAQEVCRRVGTRLETVEFPAITYSLTEFAAPFAGTVSLSADTARAALIGVLRGIGQAGFRRVCVVNHHLEPAHFKLVHAAASEAQAGTSLRVVVPDHRRKPTGPALGDEFMHGGSHAGCYETSLMLAAAPHLVNEEVRRTLPSLDVDLPGAIKQGATNFLEAGGPEAYFGAPSRATADEGQRLFELIVTATLDAMKD